MEEIILSIYELFGVKIADIEPVLTTSYTALSITMLLISISGFIVHYYVIDNVRWDRKSHLWISSALVTILTVLVTFLLIQEEDPAVLYLCIINGIFSLLMMIILSSISILRNYSTNCKHTTFWKP